MESTAVPQELNQTYLLQPHTRKWKAKKCTDECTGGSGRDNGEELPTGRPVSAPEGRWHAALQTTEGGKDNTGLQKRVSIIPRRGNKSKGGADPGNPHPGRHPPPPSELQTEEKKGQIMHPVLTADLDKKITRQKYDMKQCDGWEAVEGARKR